MQYLGSWGGSASSFHTRATSQFIHIRWRDSVMIPLLTEHIQHSLHHISIRRKISYTSLRDGKIYMKQLPIIISTKT